jgi:putative tricarboxylic transport membrane protein
MREPGTKAKASVVAGVFLLLGAFICVEALQVPLGTVRMPGAGFFPLLLGLALGVCSIILLGMSLASPAGGATTHVWPDRPEVVYLVGSLLAAVWLFERAGFLLTMTLFLGVAMRVLGTMSWSRAFVLAMVGSVASYVVFSRGLLIALPSGILPY